MEIILIIASIVLAISLIKSTASFLFKIAVVSLLIGTIINLLA